MTTDHHSHILEDAYEEDFIKKEKSVEELIKEAKANQWTELDLGEYGLQTIPEEVFELTSLERLLLHDNSLSQLPDDILKLTNLRELGLSMNEFESVPKILGKLPKLGVLDLYENSIKEIPDYIEEFIGLRDLNIAGNYLSRISEKISCLTSLESLRISGVSESLFLERISQLQGLKSLQLEGCILSEASNNVCFPALEYFSFEDSSQENFPDFIMNCKSLESISVFRTSISQIPFSLFCLPYIKTAYLIFNDIQVIEAGEMKPSEFLEEVNLMINSLAYFPDCFFALKGLKKLNLSENKIKVVEGDFTQLDSLTRLNLRRNQLEIFPVEVLKAPRLNELYLHSNPIRFVGDEILVPNSLQSLTLQDCRLTTADELRNLSNLTYLNISDNPLSDFSFLEGLQKLKELRVADCNLHKIPDEVFGLSNLQRLDYVEMLHFLEDEQEPYANKLYQINSNILDLPELKEFHFDDSELESPPREVAQGGLKAIRNYFERCLAKGVTPLHEAKVMLVGEPEAGKTTLRNLLLDPSHEVIENQKDSTLGVEITKDWQFPFPDAPDKEFTANVWDFGGQQIQYMTHQFFLTSRCLYVLVVDDRREHSHLDYWFKIINLLGEGSPVLVVSNKKKHGSASSLDLGYYRKMYPELDIEEFTLNLKEKGQKLQNLTGLIQEKLCSLKHVGADMPAQWVHIREELEKLPQNSISITEFFDICQKHELTEESDQLFLSSYLHALGVIIHFQKDPELRDLVILNPHWAIDAVYTVLSDSTLDEQNGKFDFEWLDSLWKKKGYPYEVRGKFLRLMLKNNFEICYQLPGQANKYIVPQKLSSIRPEKYQPVENENSLQFQLQYDFMPEGIMTRLIVRLNEKIRKIAGEEIVWSKGVQLTHKNVLAEVSEEVNEDKIKVLNIKVNGPTAVAKKDFLTAIRNEIQTIHQRSFKNIRVSEKIPCYCQECADHEMPFFFKLKVLSNFIEKGKSHIACHKSSEDVSIRRLIEGIVDPAKENEHDIIYRVLERMPNFNIKNDIKQVNNQSVNQNQQVSQSTELSVEIKTTLNGLAAALEEIEEQQSSVEIPEEAAAKLKEAREIAGELQAANTKEDIPKGKLNKLKRIISSMSNASNPLGGWMQKIEDGKQMLSELTGYYNQFAEAFHFPMI